VGIFVGDRHNPFAQFTVLATHVGTVHAYTLSRHAAHKPYRVSGVCESSGVRSEQGLIFFSIW
jgi:hypothetical protein